MVLIIIKCLYDVNYYLWWPIVHEDYMEVIFYRGDNK